MKSDEQKGWAVTSLPNGEYHVHPMGDIDVHVLDGAKCQCGPRAIDGNIFSHEAFDGRQWQERAAEIMSNPDKFL